MTLFTTFQFLWGEGSFILLLFTWPLLAVACFFFFAYRRKRLEEGKRVLHWKHIPSLKRQYYLNMNIKMCPKWCTWCSRYYPMVFVCEDLQSPWRRRVSNLSFYYWERCSRAPPLHNGADFTADYYSTVCAAVLHQSVDSEEDHKSQVCHLGQGLWAVGNQLIYNRAIYWLEYRADALLKF